MNDGRGLVVFRFTGLKPLLLHNPANSLSSGGMKTDKERKPPPEVEAERGSYRTEDGQLAIPTVAFIRSLTGPRGGAMGRKIGKISAATGVLAGTEVLEEFARLFDPESGQALREYVIDLRPVVVVNARILRARAKLMKWACDVPIAVDPYFITPSQLLELWLFGGRIAGVGDYRPQCGGFFGRYTVEVRSNELDAAPPPETKEKKRAK